MPVIRIVKAELSQHFEDAKLLFREYAASLNFDLAYQGFEKELLTIASQYAPPDGVLLLCFAGDNPVGCAGVRKFSNGICELKRLYVKPNYRNLSMGKKLLKTAINVATELNYKFIRLDTVHGQSKAQELYRHFGFYTIAPYRYSPIEGTAYFEKCLGCD